jgi:hypothetical protein
MTSETDNFVTIFNFFICFQFKQIVLDPDPQLSLELRKSLVPILQESVWMYNTSMNTSICSRITAVSNQ